jgi:hypothetical protein
MAKELDPKETVSFVGSRGSHQMSINKGTAAM